MVPQHPDHLARRRTGHKPKQQFHLIGAEHRTAPLPYGAIEDVTHQRQRFTGMGLELLEKALGLCPSGAQVNVTEKQVTVGR